MTFLDYLDRRNERQERRPTDKRAIANLIGLGLIAAFIGALIMLCWRAIPPSNEQLITYMLGQLSGMALGVVSYHYAMNAGQALSDAKKTQNTGKAFEAITAVAATAGVVPATIDDSGNIKPIADATEPTDATAPIPPNGVFP